ncbi:MAG TPA: caspase family protein [Pyrinomonadaceae bacterium]|jgi:hypothetical protein|nr:caspase family protein [Pyrinomonadaceae bacterium]
MPEKFVQGHALLVGAGGDLPNTVKDAQGLASILRNDRRCAYPKTQVRTLTGAKSGRAAVLDALDELSKLQPDSSVIIYFSGHGYRVEQAGKTAHYLLTHGYDLDLLESTTINGDEFAAKLEKINSKRLLVLLDCCHAGGFNMSSATQKAKSVSAKFTKAQMPIEALRAFEKRKGRVLIASSRGSEESFAGEPYSVFTTALIAALCGEGAGQEDGYVRVADLGRYTYAAVTQLTKNRQNPTMDFEQSDNFVVSYYAAGDNQRKGLPKSIATSKVETSPGSNSLQAFNQNAWATIRGNVTIIKENQINYYGNTTQVHANNIGYNQLGWTVGTVNQYGDLTQHKKRR